MVPEMMGAAWMTASAASAKEAKGSVVRSYRECDFLSVLSWRRRAEN
jgi:hypothetical protein